MHVQSHDLNHIQAANLQKKEIDYEFLKYDGCDIWNWVIRPVY